MAGSLGPTGRRRDAPERQLPRSLASASSRMAAPSASLRRSFTYARCVLYGSVRGGDGGLSLSWPAGKPQRGQSQVSGAWTWVSSAKLGLVSWPLAHQ